MKNFVKLIQQVHEERFSVVMNRIAARKLPVAFLSIAPVVQAVEITKNLRAQGLNITRLFVIDNNPPPVNLDFDVIHVKDAAQIYPQPKYVFVQGEVETKFAKKFLSKSKIIAFNCTGSSEEVYNFFMAHLDDLQEVYESLIDEESKKTFRGYWLGKSSGQLARIVNSDMPQYILSGFIPKAGDVVIDCGACDGNTAVRFVNLGCKVYAFEMDRINFQLASAIAEKFEFVVENFGLGFFKHEMTYTHDRQNIGASRLDLNGNEKTQIITLDSYVGEKKLPHVDFIKMDVEGAELDILKGATTTIARFKPILALSAYHKLDDFWTLMNFVKSIRPDYEFAMRQYGSSREDVPFIFRDGQEEFFDSYGLDVRISSFAECVLFAR